MPTNYLQISLRTLLALSTVASIALGLWFRPYSQETRREDGALRTRFELRRDWRGRPTSHGVQAWHYRDGTTHTCQDYGTPMNDADFTALLTKTGEFDGLIWLITETIVPESWANQPGPGSVNIDCGCRVLVTE